MHTVRSQRADQYLFAPGLPPPCFTHRTFDPDEADYFYVPVYYTCLMYPIYSTADHPWYPGPLSEWATLPSTHVHLLSVSPPGTVRTLFSVNAMWRGCRIGFDIQPLQRKITVNRLRSPPLRESPPPSRPSAPQGQTIHSEHLPLLE